MQDHDLHKYQLISVLLNTADLDFFYVQWNYSTVFVRNIPSCLCVFRGNIKF